MRRRLTGYGTPQAALLQDTGRICVECIAKRITDGRIPNGEKLIKEYGYEDMGDWYIDAEGVRWILRENKDRLPVTNVYIEGYGDLNQTVLDKYRCEDCKRRLRHACTDY